MLTAHAVTLALHEDGHAAQCLVRVQFVAEQMRVTRPPAAGRDAHLALALEERHAIEDHSGNGFG